MKLNGSDTAVSTLSVFLKHGRTSTTHTCPSVQPGLGRVVDVPICSPFISRDHSICPRRRATATHASNPEGPGASTHIWWPESLLSALVIVPKHRDSITSPFGSRRSDHEWPHFADSQGEYGSQRFTSPGVLSLLIQNKANSARWAVTSPGDNAPACHTGRDGGRDPQTKGGREPAHHGFTSALGGEPQPPQIATSHPDPKEHCASAERSSHQGACQTPGHGFRLRCVQSVSIAW